jgi:starch synthase (maltosyl-transferring)
VLFGPRIYDLDAHPPLGLDALRRELPRIARMHFDWVHVPTARWTIDDRDLSAFTAHAEDHGLWVVADLAMPEEDGASPDGLTAFHSAAIERLIKLGVRGVFCTSAYRESAERWRTLIDATRTSMPEFIFLGEALGVAPDRVESLRDAGFDYLLNSARWWDFRSDWLLDQYERFRGVAPTISFPAHEALNGGDPEETARWARDHYLFSACFSSGVMMPAGFEYCGADVSARPSSSNQKDITEFVTDVNLLRESLATLNQEGPQRRVTAPGAPVTALLRTPDRGEGARTLLLVNSDARQGHRIEPGPLLAEAGGDRPPLIDATPLAERLPLEPDHPIELGPLEVRLFKEADRLIVPASHQRGIPPAMVSKIRPRIAIASVRPEIDDGRFPAKRVVGDIVEVSADIFGDGHDQLQAQLLHRESGSIEWHATPMRLVENDRWAGHFGLARNTRYSYTIEAWRDLFATWSSEYAKKRQAKSALPVDLTEGETLFAKAVKASEDGEAKAFATRFEKLRHDPEACAAFLLSDDARRLMRRIEPRADVSQYGHVLEVVADRTAARYASWYEIFPRSAANDGKRHGTFADVAQHLPRIQKMGFDVLYFPPIHPIGTAHRKGRNNALSAGPDDPGSVYAIGSPDGGHMAVHPQLGTIDDFKILVRQASDLGIEIALDFAVQCSPDHPWTHEHPEWFAWRPDGKIKYAENPPKKYEDIVNFDFGCEDWRALWTALRDVVEFWIGCGVRIFRVDNPHTKPMPFWEWLIGDIQKRRPDVLFLSEAFTRPKPMQALGKAGFTQSYTYFTWRNTKAELTDYLTELSHSTQDFLRPNFFVNTPDINPTYLQESGRGGFMIRAALAATLSSLWGVYNGFELCEATPIPGREEYLDSEKYELKAWDWDRPGNIVDYITRLNHIRRDNPALHDFANIRFLTAHDDRVLFYAKTDASGLNLLWIAITLEPRWPRDVPIEIPLETLDLDEGATVEAEELFSGERVTWNGRHHRIRLDPNHNPCAIWRIVDPMVDDAAARRT